MGATQSSSLPSKEEILRKTQGGRDIVNQVFDWMVNKTNLRELYALANPEKCKQYIFLTADALDVVFKKIEIEPREGKKGTIYFQKVEELTRTGAGAENIRAQQRKVICLKLAFLYVRIFQVFASLALSVLDVDPQADIRLYQELGRYRGIEEEVPLFGEKIRTAPGLFRGGAIATSRSLPTLLEPLRSVLNETGDQRYLQLSGIPVFIDIRSMEGYLGYPIFYEFASSAGKKQQIKAKIRAESRNLGDEVVLTLGDIKDQEGRSYNAIEIVFRRGSAIGSGFKHKGKTYNQMIMKVFEAVRAGRDYEEDTSDERGITYDRYNYNRIDRTGRDRIQEYGTGRVSEGLHTETLVKALRQALPPKAHCVARALQLLSDAGLKASVPPEIYTSVCQTKFLSENRSLPAGNESITKSIGIYALAQLFYDTIRGASPEISESTKEQYNAFLLKMKFVFEESTDKTVPKGIDSVRNKLPAALCTTGSTGTTDHVLKLSNRDTIRRVRVIASQMLNYQIKHVANVTNVLRKLFLLPIESGKPLAIHPNVRKNGLMEVNRIAEEARTLLIAYYSDCEIMYRQGVEVFVEKKDLLKTI